MKSAWILMEVGAFMFLSGFAGCASGDGGQLVSGILQGIGQGLSGL